MENQNRITLVYLIIDLNLDLEMVYEVVYFDIDMYYGDWGGGGENYLYRFTLKNHFHSDNSKMLCFVI